MDARTRIDGLVTDRAPGPGRGRRGRGVIIPRIHRGCLPGEAIPVLPPMGGWTRGTDEAFIGIGSQRPETPDSISGGITRGGSRPFTRCRAVVSGVPIDPAAPR